MPSAGRRTRRRSVRKQETQSLIFGRFDGETVAVSSLSQLAAAIRQHWEQATRVVQQRALWDFVRQFDQDTAEKVQELERYQDVDAAVFQLLSLVDREHTGIFYRGKE